MNERERERNCWKDERYFGSLINCRCMYIMPTHYTTILVIKGSDIETAAVHVIMHLSLAGVKKFLQHGWKQAPTPTHSQPPTVPEVR